MGCVRQLTTLQVRAGQCIIAYVAAASIAELHAPGVSTLCMCREVPQHGCIPRQEVKLLIGRNRAGTEAEGMSRR